MTLYNPHLLDRQELIETFLARRPLLDGLLDDLRRGGGQHHLLIGSRGSGKTTLLLRFAAAIEDDAALTRKCTPLRFPEEQYNVSRPSDFWMNAGDALVDALERQGDHAAARRLEATLGELEPLEEEPRARRALALLEAWARQAKRLIVLLVDNFDLVVDRLAKSLWELREALSADNRLVVIGASSRFLGEVIDYESPLYDFFRVHELGPLSEAEARTLVMSLAQRARTENVVDVLERDPARFQALYALTGGTPRTLALLHSVLALEHGDSVERDLDRLLDRVTPHYKARFDDLPPQSQLIVDKVALHWHPITAAACHAATRIDLNTVSAQLNRLVKSGVLTKVSLPAPSKLGFQIAERLFNVWYLMRASRRLRRRLTWFVEFLRTFYGEDNLRQRAEELLRSAPRETLRTPEQFLAFASAVEDGALRRRLELQAIAQQRSRPLPEHPLAAISNVRSVADVAQLAELTQSRMRAVWLAIVATERHLQPLADPVLEQLLDEQPLDAEAMLLGVATLADKHDWNRVRHLISLITRRHATEGVITAFVVFLAECVLAGRETQALALLDEAELAERWAPLAEALRTVIDGDVARIHSLAPEMRATALSLYDQLRTTHALPDGHAPADRAPRDEPSPRKPSAAPAMRAEAGRRGRRAAPGRRRGRRDGGRP